MHGQYVLTAYDFGVSNVHPVTVGKQYYEGNPVKTFTKTTMDQCLGRAQVLTHLQGTLELQPTWMIFQ